MLTVVAALAALLAAGLATAGSAWTKSRGMLLVALAVGGVHLSLTLFARPSLPLPPSPSLLAVGGVRRVPRAGRVLPSPIAIDRPLRFDRKGFPQPAARRRSSFRRRWRPWRPPGTARRSPVL